MGLNKINDFFDNFLKREPLFVNKKVLQAAYTPDNIPHRDKQVEEMANILAPALRLDSPSNLFVYGKTGTGKTLVAKYVTGLMQETANKNQIPLKIFYLNCKLKKIADTEYRLIAQLSREFKKAIPPTGLPTDEVYRIFYEALDEKEQIVVLILDEIDQLAKKAGDEILYNLTRINSELKKSKIALVGISNDLIFSDSLDPRVKSSLSEEELLFPPYNALQIQDILKRRSVQAFQKGVLQPGVIEKCAAYAAREHGDARRALELLRVAGELAERSSAKMVEIEHIDLAEDKIERDRIIDITANQPRQFQATLYSIILSANKKAIFTGEIYEVYRKICQKINLRPLTQRRVSDIIAELDMLGIINAKVISKGRYGRTREISLVIDDSILEKIKEMLEKSLGLS